jgi:membrane fusion protein (multidrug efflux system)
MNKRMFQMLAAVVLVIGALGFVKYQQIRAAIAGGKAYQPPPEAVTTVVAKSEHWQATIEAVGSVAAVQGVTLSADQPGLVSEIGFESGAHVREGDVLVRLDTRQEQAQLASAQAGRDLATSNLDRSKRLLEGKLIAQSEYDQSVAQSKQAEAAVSEFEAVIERKTIRAPFSGIVGIRQVNLGQYVHSGDPIVPLQSEDPIYVNFTVPQQRVGEMRVGGEVAVSVEGQHGNDRVGRITAIDSVVDPATRNLQVQATLGNREGRLHPGMFVQAHVRIGETSQVLSLPASAISYAPYGDSVFVVDDLEGPNGARYRGVRQQFVKVGEARGDQVAVVSGLKAGEEVVTSGAFKLRNGAAVLVDNTVQPGNNPAPKPEEN